MAVRLGFSKMDRGQRSKKSDHNDINYNSLTLLFRTTYTVELSGLSWRRCALCEWFSLTTVITHSCFGANKYNENAASGEENGESGQQ